MSERQPAIASEEGNGKRLLLRETVKRLLARRDKHCLGVEEAARAANTEERERRYRGALRGQGGTQPLQLPMLISD